MKKAIHLLSYRRPLCGRPVPEKQLTFLPQGVTCRRCLALLTPELKRRLTSPVIK